MDYTLNFNKINNGHFVFSFVPPEDSYEYKMGKLTTEKLNNICSKLPRREFSGKVKDYPEFSTKELKTPGYDLNDTRTVFILGQIVFLRRYPNPWESLILYGINKNGDDGNINWQNDFFITMDHLHIIELLLSEKDPNDVTFEDMSDILTKIEKSKGSNFDSEINEKIASLYKNPEAKYSDFLGIFKIIK